MLLARQLQDVSKIQVTQELLAFQQVTPCFCEGHLEDKWVRKLLAINFLIVIKKIKCD